MARTKITSYLYDFRNMPDDKVAILMLLNNNDLLCMAAFIDDDETPLPAPVEGLNGVAYVSYRYKWLRDILDMLRNEEPVYFIWNSNDQYAVITTEKEPIGEEERKGLLSYLFG